MDFLFFADLSKREVLMNCHETQQITCDPINKFIYFKLSYLPRPARTCFYTCNILTTEKDGPICKYHCFTNIANCKRVYCQNGIQDLAKKGIIDLMNIKILKKLR